MTTNRQTNEVFTRKEQAILRKMVTKLTNAELDLLETLVRQEVWDRTLKDPGYKRTNKDN